MMDVYAHIGRRILVGSVRYTLFESNTTGSRTLLFLVHTHTQELCPPLFVTNQDSTLHFIVIDCIEYIYINIYIYILCTNL